MLLRLEKLFDRFSDVMGWIAGVLNLLMLINVFYDAIMRYFFKTGSIAMQEMEWHLFAVVFLFGMAFTLKEDGHVRVDILYQRFSPRIQALVDALGTLFFLIPVCLLILFFSWEYVINSWEVKEVSKEAQGLPWVYLLKSLLLVMPITIVRVGIDDMI